MTGILTLDQTPIVQIFMMGVLQANARIPDLQSRRQVCPDQGVDVLTTRPQCWLMGMSATVNMEEHGQKHMWICLSIY